MAFFPCASCQKTKKVNSLQVAWALPEKWLLWLLMVVRTFFLIKCVGFWIFFVVVFKRMSGIDLCHSNIVIMSVHYFLTPFRSMLGTCHNQILFIWRLSRMPRHLNASKRNTAALTDCAMALPLPVASHNLRLPADLWWTETLSPARLLLLWHLFLPQVALPFFQWLLKAESFALAQKPTALKLGGGRRRACQKSDALDDLVL